MAEPILFFARGYLLVDVRPDPLPKEGLLFRLHVLEVVHAAELMKRSLCGSGLAWTPEVPLLVRSSLRSTLVPYGEEELLLFAVRLGSMEITSL